MNGSCTGAGRRRHLAADDIDAMFQGRVKYPLGFMTLVGAYTFDSGQSWQFPAPKNHITPWLTDRPAAVFLASSPHNEDGNQQTIVYQDPGSRLLDVIVTNGSYATYQGTTGFQSTRGAALVAQDSTTAFMASIGDNEQIEISQTVDSKVWTHLSTVDISRTSVPPALAWAPNTEALVLAWQQNGGRINFATSVDFGLTWKPFEPGISYEVSDHPFGLTCRTNPPDDECMLSFADGQLANTPAKFATFKVQAGTPLQGTLVSLGYFEPTFIYLGQHFYGYPSPDSYGMSVAENGDYLFASRDRGYHTVMSSMRPLWQYTFNFFSCNGTNRLRAQSTTAQFDQPNMGAGI